MGIIGKWLRFAFPVCVDEIDVGVLAVSEQVAAAERNLISMGE